MKVSDVFPVKWTSQQQFEFALDFSERSLARLTRDEWRDLSTQLLLFCQGGGTGTPLGRPRLAKRFPKEALLSLQADVTRLLQGLVDTREAVLQALESGDPGPRPRQFIRPLRVQLSYMLTAEEAPWYQSEIEPEHAVRNSHSLVMVGSMRDVVLSVLVRVLSEQLTHRKVRRCVCGRVFARAGRQKYCRKAACAKKRQQAYWADYITTPKGVAARKNQYKELGYTYEARKKKAVKPKGTAKR